MTEESTGTICSVCHEARQICGQDEEPARALFCLPCDHQVCAHCAEKATAACGEISPLLMDCPACHAAPPLTRDVEKPRDDVEIMYNAIEAVRPAGEPNDEPAAAECAPPVCNYTHGACAEGTEASHYCAECAEFFCAQCHAQHSRSRGTRAHTLYESPSLGHICLGHGPHPPKTCSHLPSWNTTGPTSVQACAAGNSVNDAAVAWRGNAAEGRDMCQARERAAQTLVPNTSAFCNC